MNLYEESCAGLGRANRAWWAARRLLDDAEDCITAAHLDPSQARKRDLMHAIEYRRMAGEAFAFAVAQRRHWLRSINYQRRIAALLQ